MLGKTPNVTPLEQCHLSAFGLGMILFPQSYIAIGCVAQHTGGIYIGFLGLQNEWWWWDRLFIDGCTVHVIYVTPLCYLHH